MLRSTQMFSVPKCNEESKNLLSMNQMVLQLINFGFSNDFDYQKKLEKQVNKFRPLQLHLKTFTSEK